MSSVVIARVGTVPSSWGYGSAEGAIVSQPSSPVMGSPPSQGRVVDAFRPAWASWMPGTLPRSRIEDVI
jgi:hypothetical protein